MTEDDHELAFARRLAEKINLLFATVYPAERGKPYSPEEVSAWLEETSSEGPTISANYIRYLRRGEKTNPGVQYLVAIARFFQVDLSYLLSEDEKSQRMHDQLVELGKIRNARAYGIALRASQKDPKTQEWLYQLITTMPDSEQAPEDESGDGSDGSDGTTTGA